MKTVGIICEYNPFHFGHQRQIDQIRDQFGEDTAIVCAMSGNFVQRGMPAMWDKFTRARAAVACGADLVLELPVTKVLQSAEGFARGGVELLTRISCVDTLCFGAECGNTEKLMSAAHQLDRETTALRDALSLGLPYAAARQAAINDHDGLLSSPNNILAVEYCRALRSLNSTLTPFAIQRNGDYHAQSPDAKEPSATSIRALFPTENWHEFVPPQAVKHFTDAPWFHIRFGERAILARLRALTDDEWEACAHGSEGLWSKAMKAARSETSLEDIITQTKSKRYPRTRIQRLIMCAYLGITAENLNTPLPYARILAASDAGRRLIRKIKTESDLPLINPGETPEKQSFYRIETRCSDLFTLFSASELSPCKSEQNARMIL